MAMAMATEVAENGDGPCPMHNSPWKKPETLPAESPVMGVKMWPSLSDMQRTKKTVPDAPNVDSEVPPIADSQVVQNSNGHTKSHAGGGKNSSHKNGQQRYNKGGSKRNQNAPPPFPVPLVPQVYPPGVPVLRPISGNAYGSQPIRAPFPGADTHSGKSGSQAPVKAFPPQLHSTDAHQTIQPPARGDVDGFAPKLSSAKTNAVEGGGPGHFYHVWQHPWANGPKGGIMVPQNMPPPRAFMRPAFFGPPPFVGGPPFPGPGNMHYRPNLPPGAIRPPLPPWFAPRLVNPMVHVPPNPLRERIVKQIEYYFSDENLLTDNYLISQMDDQGWVSISVIADFKRVKMMSTDTLFILDALQKSRSVEVQGNMMRRRDRPSKYAVVSPSEHKMVSEGPNSTTVGNNGSLSRSDSKMGISASGDMCGHLRELKVDGSVENADVTDAAVYESGLPANDG